MKLAGSISYVVQPGYPKLISDEGTFELQVNYLLNEDEVGMDLHQIRGDFLDQRFPMFFNLNLRCQRYSLTPKPGHKVWLLEVTYSSGDAETGDSPDLKEVIEMSTEDYEVPLSQVNGYRVCWDHVLLRKNGSSKVAAWWENASDTVLPDSSNAEFKWAKAGADIPDGWHVFKSETMPGVNGKLTGTRVVTVTTYGTKQQLSKKSKKDYTKEPPPETFNMPGEWLRGGSSIRKEGKKWALTVQYRNFDHIDPRLYGN